MPEMLASPAHDHVAVPRYLDDIVGDQPVSPLHEIERYLALPDAAPPYEEQADPVHIDERAVEGCPRREHEF